MNVNLDLIVLREQELKTISRRKKETEAKAYTLGLRLCVSDMGQINVTYKEHFQVNHMKTT